LKGPTAAHIFEAKGCRWRHIGVPNTSTSSLRFLVASMTIKSTQPPRRLDG